MAEQKFGAISLFTAFFIALIPLVVGFSLTGKSIAIPAIGSSANLVVGWLFVIAGVLSLYIFFTTRNK